MAGMTDRFELECLLLSRPLRGRRARGWSVNHNDTIVFVSFWQVDASSWERRAAINFDSDSAAVVDAEWCRRNSPRCGFGVMKAGRDGKARCPSLQSLQSLHLLFCKRAWSRGSDSPGNTVGALVRGGLFMLAGKRCPRKPARHWIGTCPTQTDFYDAVSLAANNLERRSIKDFTFPRSPSDPSPPTYSPSIQLFPPSPVHPPPHLDSYDYPQQPTHFSHKIQPTPSTTHPPPPHHT